MSLYKCECGTPLDIEDGLLCSKCWVHLHGQKPTKQEPSYENLLHWLNDPTVEEFFESVKKEIVFQRQAWGHLDREKRPSHWFWLIAKLASKALEDGSKRRHHIVTSAACLYLWLKSEES
jgi:hypothetical protein